MKRYLVGRRPLSCLRETRAVQFFRSYIAGFKTLPLRTNLSTYSPRIYIYIYSKRTNCASVFFVCVRAPSRFLSELYSNHTTNRDCRLAPRKPRNRIDNRLLIYRGPHILLAVFTVCMRVCCLFSFGWLSRNYIYVDKNPSRFPDTSLLSREICFCID